jgi:cytochrome c2
MKSSFEKIYAAAALTVGLVLSQVPAHADDAQANISAGNIKAGRVVFLHQCAGCHSNLAGVDRFGPTLQGVYGRKAGTAPHHLYSRAMAASGIVWNDQTLNGFLTNPHVDLPGTIMPYRGLASAAARANVIAYLRSISPDNAK